MANRGVIFLTEAGKHIGMGHLNRCLALADGFRWHGVNSRFFIRGCDEPLSSTGAFDFNFVEWFDKKTLLPLIENADLLVVDTYEAESDLLDYIAEQGGHVVFLVDSKAKYSLQGTILYPSIYAEIPADQPKDPAKCIIGRKYLLYPKRMWGLPEFQIREMVSTIAVCLGGFFKPDLLTPIVEVVKEVYPNADIEVFGSLTSGTSNQKERVHWHGLLSKDDYLNKLYTADLSITGAGMSLNENMLIGLPSLAVIINDSQTKNAIAWNEAAGVPYVYANELEQRDTLRKILNRFRCKTDRLTMKRAFKNAIDENGAKRAAEEILKIHKA